jgi:hypothetical protein
VERLCPDPASNSSCPRRPPPTESATAGVAPGSGSIGAGTAGFSAAAGACEGVAAGFAGAVRVTGLLAGTAATAGAGIGSICRVAAGSAAELGAGIAASAGAGGGVATAAFAGIAGAGAAVSICGDSTRSGRGPAAQAARSKTPNTATGLMIRMVFPQKSTAEPALTRHSGQLYEDRRKPDALNGRNPLNG